MSENNGAVNVTFARAFTHQKQHMHSGPSTRSAFGIFNTLRLFTHGQSDNKKFKVGVYESLTIQCVAINFVEFIYL